MGRKRNQGKARKAAKEQQQSLDMYLMQKMRADGTLCTHGFDPRLRSSEDFCFKFVDAFRESFYEAAEGAGRLIADCLLDAREATKDKFAIVWDDCANMEFTMSIFLCNGTQHILDNEYDTAREVAAFARYLQHHIAVELKQSQALHHKVLEAYEADVHTLVKFFRKRIPCSCLDEKYEEVKDITKMSVCYNPQCINLDGKVERSKTMCCSRCRCVTYCSRECQKSHWKTHKPQCERNAAVKTEFEAK